MNESINKAIALLKQDEVVAIPTETVYGLAGNAFSEKAIRSIYEIKNRPAINPLIVHIKNKESIFDIAKNVPDEALLLAAEFWPGPLTLILEKQDHISPSITANKDTVGVRVPNHETTLKLLNQIDFPLVAPSANKSNHISPTTPEHVKRSLASKAPFVLDGGTCKSGIESTIIGFKNGDIVLYRHGAIAKEEIESVLKRTVVEVSNSIAPESPGMFKKHYSPNTDLILTKDLNGELERVLDKKVGILTFQNTIELDGQFIQKVLSPEGNHQEAASKLYATLYELDSMELDVIIVEEAPQFGLGVAINDRLKRAAYSTRKPNMALETTAISS